MNSLPHSPELSIILPTDTFETIEPVLRKLRAQTIASRIELIFVGPSAQALEKAKIYEAEFASLLILEIAPISPLGDARAAGIRAATAAFVFVGETHSYLHSDAAEKLLATAWTGSWDAVTPGFENANPGSVISWAAFLTAYGVWSATLPAGEILEAPLYDTLYRRDVLLEMGNELAPMLSGGDDLRRALQARGRRIYFEPSARIEHLNMVRFVPWMHEYFLIGLMIGSRRAHTWPWWRRLVYIAGAPLIPFVLCRRIWSKIKQTARAKSAPVGIFPLVVFAFVLKAAGEVMGYVGGGSVKDIKAMNLYEVRRIDYVS